MSDIVIALVSGAAGWYLSHSSMLASEDAAVLSGYIDEIEACSDAVEQYWLTAPDTENEEKALAAFVRARIASLGVIYGEAPKYLRQSHLQNYHVKQRRFFGEATGGEFESPSRPIDPNRAIEAHRISREIVQTLRLARREQLSPVHWVTLKFKRLQGISNT